MMGDHGGTESAEKTWTAGRVVELLREKYKPAQRYAVFEQVANATGAYNRYSWIDVAVVNLWPSDGAHRSAFEVKVSRADFMKEMQDPTKNAWARECFDYFYYVTAPGVVKSIDEIPEGCGWMLCTEKRVLVKKAARRREKVTLDSELLAALCRSSQQWAEERLRTAREDILKTDTSVERMRRCERVLQKFFELRGASFPYRHPTDESLLEAIQQAAQERGERHLRDHVQERLRCFQNDMLDAFWSMAALACFTLDATDETGKFIHSWRTPERTEIKASCKDAFAKGRAKDLEQARALLRFFRGEDSCPQMAQRGADR